MNPERAGGVLYVSGLGWEAGPGPDLAGVLLTPRLGFDPQSGRNSQRVGLLGSS